MRLGLTDWIKNLYGKPKLERHGRFTLQYDEPCGYHESSCVSFYRSNEDYKDTTINILTLLRNIKKYVGVCGAFTQNLFLVGKLLENNNIESIILVDENDDQLRYVSKILKKYNNSRSDKEYIKALEHEKVESISSIHRQRPKIYKNDVRIHLVPGNFENYLEERIKTKDTYFLYFSNILDSAWLYYKGMDYKYSLKILKGVLRNDNIDNGSIVFMFDMASMDAVVLEKKNEKFVLPDGEIPAHWHNVLYNCYNDGIIAQR